MVEVIYDAIKDSLTVVPFLLLVYLLMEVIESSRGKEKIEKALGGTYAPVFAAVSGVIPECGFSVMCAKLYDSRLIKVGTLLAAFIATSDEALILLLSNGAYLVSVGMIVLWKILFAVFIGETVNVLTARFSKNHVCPIKDDCIECGEHHEKFFDKFLLHPLYHTAKTFCYLLAVTFALNLIVYFIGEENIFAFMNANVGVQPLITAIVGIVPNCASSILLAEGFMSGIIGFPALLTGLAVNSGVGLLMLFKSGKKIKRNTFICITLLLSGILLGYLAMI